MSRHCPDDGTCHHSCDVGCWRVRNAGPLSGVYRGDEWPLSVLDLPATFPPFLTGDTAPRPSDPAVVELVAKILLAKVRAQAKGPNGRVSLLLTEAEARALHRIATRELVAADPRFADLAPSRRHVPQLVDGVMRYVDTEL